MTKKIILALVASLGLIGALRAAESRHVAMASNSCCDGGACCVEGAPCCLGSK